MKKSGSMLKLTIFLFLSLFVIDIFSFSENDNEKDSGKDLMWGKRAPFCYPRDKDNPPDWYIKENVEQSILETLEKLERDSNAEFPDLRERYSRGWTLPEEILDKLMTLYKTTEDDVLKKRIAINLAPYLTNTEAAYFIQQFREANDVETKNRLIWALRYWGGQTLFDISAKILKEELPFEAKENLLGILSYSGYSSGEKYAPEVEMMLENVSTEYGTEIAKRIIIDSLQTMVEIQGHSAQEVLLNHLQKDAYTWSDSDTISLLRLVGDEKIIPPLLDYWGKLRAGKLHWLDEDGVYNLGGGIDYWLSLLFQEVSLETGNQKYGNCLKWHEKHSDFNRRKAQIAFCEKYFDNFLKKTAFPPKDEGEYFAKVQYSQSDESRFIKSIMASARHLDNREILPYIEETLQAEYSPFMFPAQKEAAKTAIKWGYREGYESLIDQAFNGDLTAMMDLKRITGQFFPTKDEWMQWLDSNKDKFKTISSVK